MNFLEEYKKLQLKTPRLNFFHLNSINSDYCYNVENVKNCYLLANACENEDCMYGRDFYGCKDCNDCDHVRNCTLCFECLNCENCYNCNFVQDSMNSSDCWYGYGLKGCKNCIGCVGLKQKQFCIFNEKYTQDEYRKKVATLNMNTVSENFEKLKKTVPLLGLMQIDCENSSGNSLFHCKNVIESFDASECQDSGYLLETKKLKDCFDITVLENSELCYQISSCHVMNNCNFCFFCVECSDVEYSECMTSCRDCFGCISLYRKQYYILNQPYSKDDYFKKVAEIKDQLRSDGLYGQMLLPSAFPRSDTVAVWDKM